MRANHKENRPGVRIFGQIASRPEILCAGSAFASWLIHRLPPEPVHLHEEFTLSAMNGRRPSATFWPVTHALFVCLALLACFTQRSGAQSGEGQWEELSGQVLSNINPVHMALMNNGSVLMVAGSGNVANDTSFESVVWNPVTRSFGQSQTWWWDMFCNGMVVLPDGRVLINGGTLAYDSFKGEKRSAVYDPATGAFADVESMAHGRWYPTVTVLGDGRVMTFSGLTETGGTNSTVEFYTPGAGWSQEYPAGWVPPLYPRMHLLTNGKVAYVGSGRGTRTYDPATNVWTSVATTLSSITRTYGTSVLLPLSPADGYRSRVMIFGGGNPSTKTTELIDFSAPTPQWTNGPDMQQPRIEMNATILPNGKVLATGGSLNDEDGSPASASLKADLYDPATNTFTPAGSNRYARLYHSNALLLPDATVLLAGGNPARGTVERHLEIYKPAYLFNGSRPSIEGVTPGAPATIGYGNVFQVQTAEASSIASVVLVRPGAPTHAFDMDQRLVKLSFTAGSGALSVTMPPNGNIAPPGYYMLFILNSAGTPSEAKFVRLGTTVGNQAPTASITAPGTNVTINAGQAVSFTGSGTDPDGTITAYNWTFPGGTPGTSTSQTPIVTYSTPGSRTASLTVTDNGGLTSSPATRTITVADFSLSATPSSSSVTAGAGATYTVTVNPGTGFSGNVALSVTSGLPAGASATFSPASVLTSGSSTMTVSTSAATPAGNYTLTISGDTGAFKRTTTVTLVVADFTLSATPTSQSVTAGTNAAYTVSVNPGSGFSGNVGLSVTNGLPAGASASFNPASILTSGSSTMTVSTSAATPVGSYALTIAGSTGGLTRTTTSTLVITAPIPPPPTLDFSLSVSPTSALIKRADKTTFTITITGQPGFNGPVALTVSGLPKFASSRFSASSVNGSGTSTLTINTNKNVSTGSNTLTVTATSGSLVHSQNVTLTIGQ